MRKWMRTLSGVWALLVIASVLPIDMARANPAAALEPYVATYEVTYRGLSAGALRMELKREGNSNRYTFETHADPSFLARLVVGRNAVERTTFELTPDGLLPIEWYLEDGKSGTGGDGHLKFDWAAGKVSGEYEGERVELPTQPGLQDRLSIQVAVSAALAQGREVRKVAMVNGDKIREYSYTRGANETLDTALGQLETVIYESTRPGSSRVSKVWHVPELEFIAARAEQIRKGKVETVMVLVGLERR